MRGEQGRDDAGGGTSNRIEAGPLGVLSRWPAGRRLKGRVPTCRIDQLSMQASIGRSGLKGIGCRVRLEVKRGLGLAPATLVGRTLYLGARESRVELFDELDLGPLEEAVQLLDVGVVEDRVRPWRARSRRM